MMPAHLGMLSLEPGMAPSAPGRPGDLGAAALALHRTATEGVIAAERAGKAHRMATATADEIRILMAVLNKVVPAIQAIEHSVLQAEPLTGLFEDMAATAHVLALNAELQADRANGAIPTTGVLAEELRSLSKQCASAGRSIAELIETVSRDIGLGAALAMAAGDAARGAGQQFQALTSQLDTIVQASGRQAVTIRDIEETITALHQAGVPRSSQEEA